MIPTAEEWLENDTDYDSSEEMLIKFAELHVEAALKAASKSDIDNGKLYKHRSKSDKESILNAYPLENIK